MSWYTICMKENLIHYRTCVCNINYHMVWSVKYRRKILNAEVEAYLQELVQEIAEDKGFTVHLFECGEGDHVHCFVSAPPKLSITAIVKYLKGISGTIPIMWKRSDLYRKKTSAGISNIRAKRTDTMEERKCCCQRKHP